MAGKLRSRILWILVLGIGGLMVAFSNLQEKIAQNAELFAKQDSTKQSEDEDDEPEVVATTRRIQPYKGWKSMQKLGIDRKKGSRGARVDEPMHETRNPDELVLSPAHYIYMRGMYDGAPIIIAEFKLVFFTIPKVGCTVFKQLFRRMAGHQNWRLSKVRGLPHDPATNGLKYLHHFSKETAHHMLTSPEWTRAIFLRDPKERILSAYLDKGLRKNAQYVNQHCCLTQACNETASASFEGFLQIAHSCPDPHWNPLSQRMEGRYWPYLDFVGHDFQRDTKILLEKLGAWDEYGASGWGQDGTEEIFESAGTVKHETRAGDRMLEFYTLETERMVEDLYRGDYENNLLGFNNTVSATRLFVK